MKRLVIISITDHEKGNGYVEEVNERLDEYGVEGMVLALEALKSYRRRDGIWKHAKGMGMSVIPIDSRLARDIVDPWLKEEEMYRYACTGIPEVRAMKEQGIYEEVMKEQRMNKAKHEYIMCDLRNRSMVRRVMKEEPDIIVCGAFHADAIAKEIPAEEFIQIGEYTGAMRYYDREVRERIDWMLKERARIREENIDAHGKP